jgi:hypothetical protein
MSHTREAARETPDQITGHLSETRFDVRIIEVIRIAIEKYALCRTLSGIDEHRSEDDRVRELELVSEPGRAKRVRSAPALLHDVAASCATR